MVMLLIGTLSLLGIVPALAQEVYNLKEYEQLIGKKLTFQEAPELRVKVAAGELPPVEKRLPEEPLVVKPAEEIGQYGGTWRWPRIRSNELWAFFSYEAGEFLVRYSPDFKKVVPNVAKDFKWSKDAKTVTFYLRKGMKWSDGAPFTADDFVFWYKDIILNDQLTPAKPAWLKVGGELGKLEKINEYTFKISFTQPYGFLTEKLSGWWAPNLYAPKHYLKQFHPKYTSMDKIKKEMKKEGFDTWIDLFESKNTIQDNPNLPVITAWHVINSTIKPIQRAVRNPYYWKIDTKGNQLPYINHIQSTLLPDRQALLLKAIAGDIDFAYRRIQGVQNYTLMMQNQKKGNYKVWMMINPSNNFYTIFLNYHHKDPVLRKLIRNKQFRIALSVAINRNEVNELTQKGLGKPAQVTPAPGSAWYSEKLAKLYTEYDPQRANEILDKLGLKWDKNHEYRLRADGKRLKFIINAFTPWPIDNVEAMELVKGYWKKIGIQTVVKPTSRDLWVKRVTSCDFDVASYVVSTGWLGYIPLQDQVFPLDQYYYTAPMWGLWFATKGKSGEEPPAELKQMMKIYGEALRTASMEKRNELIKEAVKINVENLLQIGMVCEPNIGRFGIVKNNFRNVPNPPLSGDLTIYQPSTWFIKK